MAEITGVVVWKPKSDARFNDPACCAIYTKNGQLKAQREFDVGTWLNCQYDPSTKECFSVQEIKPPISTRCFNDASQVHKLHLLFFGLLYKRPSSAYDFYCHELGKVNSSLTMAKRMKDTDNCWAEYELVEDTLQLTAKQAFHPIQDDAKIISRKKLERSQSCYPNYSDKDQLDEFYESDDNYELSSCSSQEELKDRFVTLNPFNFTQSAPIVKKEVKFEDQDFKPAVQTRPFTQIHPATQVVKPIVQIAQVVETPNEYEEERKFLVFSTRYTILGMINQFVTRKPFQNEYLKVYLKSFEKSLEEAGYETPTEFFNDYPNVFAISTVDDHRIYMVKDASEEELKTMLTVYKKQTKFFDLDNSMQFKNIFYN